ncbi:restriction endonuclease subunit S [Candidatus Poseidoniaceae archaeon]|nr:restriction endonuclease subunit S [Candidatus Poseidoniaceae archaeon]
MSGLLGEQWPVKPLGEVCDFQNGFAFKSSTFREKGTPVLRISNIQNETIDTRKLVYVDVNDYPQNLESYVIRKNDLLIAMSGATTGKVGFNTEDIEFLLNQRVGKFEPMDCLDKKYLFYYLLTKVEESLRISAGAAQPNLSTKQIKNFQIPIPPLDEQQRIVSILNETFTNTKLGREKAQLQMYLYDSLERSALQEAFNGRL